MAYRTSAAAKAVRTPARGPSPRLPDLRVIGFSRNVTTLLGAAVLLLALVLRATGIDFGIPFWMVNDELPLVGGAMRMLELRNPIPSANPGPMSILYYPPGLPWLYLLVWTPLLAIQWVLGGLTPLQAFAERILSDFSLLWIAARAVSVVFSVATVWVVMRLASDIFRDQWAGIVSGLMIATSFHHGLIGHFARVWPATLFLWWVGFWAAWRVFSVGRRSDYVWAGLAAGAGFIVNYVGVLVSVAVAVAHLARHRRIVVDRAILLHAAIVAGFMAVGLATAWPDFLRLAGYSSVLRNALTSVAPPETMGVLALVGFYVGVMVKADSLLVVTGLLTLPLLLRTAPVFVTAFALPMVPYTYLVLTGYANDDRYVLPLTPIFALAVGGLVTMSRGPIRSAAIACVVAIAGVQAVTLARLDWLMLRPDTRELARAWFDENARATEGVIAAIRSVRFAQTLRAIELERELAPNSLTYMQRRRLAGGAQETEAERPMREAVHWRTVGEDALRVLSPDRLVERFVEAGYKWYVVDDMTGPVLDGRFEDLLARRMDLVASIAPGPGDVRTPLFNYTNQFERGGPFDLFRAHNLGPRVDIYRLR